MTESIIVAIISSGILSTLISGVFSMIEQNRRKKDGVADALRLTLYNDIMDLYGKVINRGSIKKEEKRHLMDMHRVYHDELGGNGFLDAEVESALELPEKG